MAARDRAPQARLADGETRGYWEGAGATLWCCSAAATAARCSTGRARCACTCLGGEIEHFEASGRGTVYTFTVTHQNQVPAFRDALPYVLAYVELEEGPRLLTNVVGCSPDDVRIGMPVRAEFRDDADGLAVPVFRPA